MVNTSFPLLLHHQNADGTPLDATVALAIGLSLTGFGLWIVTNLHIRASKKALQAYGTDARQKTEAFVGRELASLKEAIPKAPVSVSEDFESLRAEIEAINVGLRKEFEQLPVRIHTTIMAEAGNKAQEMMTAAKDLSGHLKTELAAVNASLPPEIQQMDIRGKILKAIAREPTPKERKEMGTVGELIWNFGRMKAAEYLQTEGSPGASVTYRVTQGRSPYGL